MEKEIRDKWRTLSGDNNWKGMLEPLDIDLRRYILHYGERAEATNDNFNYERKSKYAGGYYFKRSHLFHNVGLDQGNPYKYKAVKYIYATSTLPLPDCFFVKALSREGWCKESNWMGYVAVATDQGKEVLGRRDILIAWRGSIQPIEWIEDLDFPLTSAAPVFGGEADGTMVHSAWLSIYTSDDPRSPFNKASARQQVLSTVKELVEKYKDEEISITITGHSLGGALATLCATDIAVNGYNRPPEGGKPCMVTGIVFGCPRVGDYSFKNVFLSSPDLHILRIVNTTDIVPQYPFMPYTDVGEELLIDSRKSNYLKFAGGFFSRHNMEAAYLHTVAGTHGLAGDFHLEVKRDIALVNKFSNYLKDEYLVPDSWWTSKNKGMTQNVDGSWELDDLEEDQNNDVDDDLMTQ